MLTTTDIGDRMMVALGVGKIIYANESVVGGHMISVVDNVLVASR